MQKKRILFLMTYLVLLTAAVLLVPVVSAAAPTNQRSDVTFSTPEDAIRYFFDGIAEGDFSKILQACAIDEISENFRLDLSVERLRAFMPYIEYAPSDNSLYVDINKTAVASRIAGQVKIFAYSLLSTQIVDYAQTSRMDVDTAVSFMNEVDPSRLVTLEVKEIGLPNQESMNSARYQDNAIKMAHVYGADDSTERVALFTFEGNSYMLGFTLLRYGENWKISNASSPIAGTNSLGIPAKITAEEFEAMTK